MRTKAPKATGVDNTARCLRQRQLVFALQLVYMSFYKIFVQDRQSLFSMRVISPSTLR